jgi:hypothetical protein
MAASALSREWLDRVGRLATGEARPSDYRQDSDRFACILEEQPALLVPQRLVLPALISSRTDFGESKGSDQPDPEPQLEWNPRCRLCEPGEIPPDLTGVDEWREGLALSVYWTAWVHDEVHKQWRPFWMADDLAARVRSLHQPGVPADRFEALERDALQSAGVVISRGGEASKKKRWNEALARAREQFRSHGYCAINQLLHPFHIGELRRYYRRMIRRGRVVLGDFQSSRRYVAHNEPVARFFHHQLTPVVAQLVSEPVKPSYAYFASYQSGAKLKRHTDREECEFSLSFCLDYAPEPEDATPWPLYLEVGRSRMTIHQALGEALLYRGRELPHYRDRLPDGHTSTSIFFHYVRADFAGELW